MVNTPVDSKSRKVRSLMATLVRGSPPANGDALNFMEVLPQCFDGVVRGLEHGNAGTIAFKVGLGDRAIGVMEVHEHSCNANVSKSKGVVIECHQV